MVFSPLDVDFRRDFSYEKSQRKVVKYVKYFDFFFSEILQNLQSWFEILKSRNFGVCCSILMIFAALNVRFALFILWENDWEIS